MNELLAALAFLLFVALLVLSSPLRTIILH
jgi:hypothetical protein